MCNRFGTTPEAIGGKAVHQTITTCPREGCSVRYRKCKPPHRHSICVGCGDRKCDGDLHSYVGVCNGKYVHDTLWVAGCGEKIYKCTESQHQTQTYSCGHTMKACQHVSHDCDNDDDDTTDNTPDCPDCSSDCSYPCSCTNSGTCGGSDNTPDCSSCTNGCSSCDEDDDDDDDDGVLCPANAWTNCGNTTSDATTCIGGHTYYTCNRNAVDRHQSRTCARPNCSSTFSKCTNGDRTCSGGAYIYHRVD